MNARVTPESVKVGASMLNSVRKSGFSNNLMIDKAEARRRGLNYDSADTVANWFARQLEYVQTMAYKVLYPQLSALTLFPVTTEVPVGAAEMTYRGYGYAGSAKIIANGADDIPRADKIDREVTQPIRNVATYYSYSVQEARNALFSGVPLEAQKAESARYNIDREINRMAWAGNKEFGVRGIFSPESEVPTKPVAAGASSGNVPWRGKTPDEILRDVIEARAQVVMNSNGVENPDCLAIPVSEMAFWALPLTIGGVAVSESLFSYMMEKTGWLKEIVGVPELEATAYETNVFSTEASPSGTAFLFTRDRDKLRIETPLPFTQAVPQFDKFNVNIYCEASTAGAVIPYPASALAILGV